MCPVLSVMLDGMGGGLMCIVVGMATGRGLTVLAESLVGAVSALLLAVACVRDVDAAAVVTQELVARAAARAHCRERMSGHRVTLPGMSCDTPPPTRACKESHPSLMQLPHFIHSDTQ